MKKSKEAIFSSKIISYLNKIDFSFFYKVSDSFIVGIPDIYGSFNGHCCVIEVKMTKRIINGKPLLTDHKFSPKQIQNLKDFQKSKALAIGLVGCTDKCVIVKPNDIQENGQVTLDEYIIIDIKDVNLFLNNEFKDQK